MLYGCTTFTIKTDSELIFGRNLDVESDIGNVFINQRGQKKGAYFSKRSKEIPAEWRSKFGSITFNQISKDIPHGGINEKGLVVEHLYLEESVYEPSDARPALMSHQWIQYMLDNCENVNEIIESCSEVRISNTDYKFQIHFSTMDKKGDRAIVEFLNGKMLVYNIETNETGALSNSCYENSINQNEDANVDSEITHPTDVTNSLDRFRKATELVKKYSGQKIINYSFSILDTVFNNTQWQIVYDIKNLKIHYRTNSNRKKRVLSLNDTDFSRYATKTISVHDDPEIADNWNHFNQKLNDNMINSVCDKSEFINSILGKEIEEIGNFYGSAEYSGG